MNAKVHHFPIDEVPLPCPYGAAELKVFIRKYTISAVFSSIGFLVLFFLVATVSQLIPESDSTAISRDQTIITVIDLPPIQAPTAEEFTPPPDNSIANSGPVEVAGNPTPIPDALASPDMKDFAPMDKMSIASATGGDGTKLNSFGENIDWNPEKKVLLAVQKEAEPHPDDVIHVEKEPELDIGKLVSLIKYPELARRANVEGTVLLRVLVDKNGNASRIMIDYSDNQLLNKAAEDAVKSYGQFSPAIQNGVPVACWVSIPLRFRLR